MGVYSLQLVHYGAYVLHTLCHLQAYCVLDAHAECMAVLVRAQVVETVGECKCLRVGLALAELLYSAVYVTATYIDLAHLFTFERQAETEHSVCGGVLRTYVYHILVVVENLQLLYHLGEMLVLFNLIYAVSLLVGLALKTYRVYRFTGVVVLS